MSQLNDLKLGTIADKDMTSNIEFFLFFYWKKSKVSKSCFNALFPRPMQGTSASNVIILELTIKCEKRQIFHKSKKCKESQ